MNSEQINFYLEKTFSQSYSDVAHLLKYLYYSNIRFDSKNWYFFRQHQWVRLDEDQSPLIPIMKNELVNKYLMLANSYNQDVMKMTNELNAIGNVEPDKMEIYLPLLISDLTNKSKICSELGLKLNQHSFIQKVDQIAQDLFYKKDFDLYFDLKPNLIGFKNGNYNLKSMKIDVPRNKDFVFMNVGYPFNSSTIQYTKEIEQYFDNIGLNNFLPLISQFINGERRLPMIWINGLSEKISQNLISLFEATLGDYVGTLTFSTLRKRKIPHFQNHTHTDLANCCRKRLIFVEQTPEDSTSVYQPMVDILLEQESLDLRMPYNKNSNTYIPQFGLIVLSSNPEAEPPKDSIIFEVKLKEKYTEPKMIWKSNIMNLILQYYQLK